MRKLLQLKTLILLICVSFATTASAYDFYVNGIYYNQYTLSSVEVTYKNTAYNSYSGYISIPSSINVNGKTYAVIRIGDYAFKNCTGVLVCLFPAAFHQLEQMALQDLVWSTQTFPTASLRWEPRLSWIASL